MFSRENTRRVALALMVAAAGALVSACGHKAPPVPPPLRNPARTVDLAAQQRGQTAILSFSYPQTTSAGQLLETLERLEVWRTRKPLVDPDAEPELEAEADQPSEAEPEDPESSEDDDSTEEPDVPEITLESLGAADALEFNATAQLIETLDTEAIEQAVNGENLVVRVDLGEPSHEEWAHTFGVKTYASEKLVSAFSNLVTMVERRPPPPPVDFQLTAEAEGIRLTWALDPSTGEPPTGLRIYRRPAQNRIYGEPVVRLPGETEEYLDRSAVFGERYIYAITTVGNENPVSESFFGGEREIDFVDRFAPKPPTHLIALAESGRVRLLWDASPDDDVAGYVIFRRIAGSDYRRLTDDPLLIVEYNDRTVVAGTAYDYQVAAVDDSGNQSEPSAGVVARVP